jgi:hypothetical protein
MALVGTSLNVEVYTALYTSQVSDSVISVSSSTAQGRTESVLDFNQGEGVNSRDLESAFSWPISQGTILYVWQPSWINFPENSYDRNSDWMPVAGGAAGFVQGIIIEADTFNVPKIFQLQDSDTLSFHTLNEVGISGIAFNRQSIKAFSCTTPFVAHLVRVTTDDGVPWRVWNNNLIAQPFPESTMLWKTELTALGGEGFQHIRLMNLDYISTAPITLSFSVETGNGSYGPTTITIPSSGGTQAKLFLRMSPNKWKLLGFSASSTAPMNLFLEGMEVWCRSWGSSGQYRKMHPFAGPSSTAATV